MSNSTKSAASKGTSSQRLDGKIAIITGAGRGIGHAIAKRFLEAGARVVIAGLNFDRVKAAAAGLGSEKEVIGVHMDVTSEDMVNAGVAKTVKTFGTVDCLVSNAGIQIVHPLEDFSFEQWKLLLAVHLDGGFLTTKACLPHMYKQGSGSIIYMGSVHSHEASKLKSAYVTAKHGLIGLARTVSKEGGPHGVRANVVCPGFVRTDLVEKQIPEQARDLGISEKEVVETIMLGETVDKEFTTVADVAEITLMFAAFPTNALTGQSLIVSHGWHMN